MTLALPTPGGSPDTWGAELNAWFGVAHNPDGTLDSSAVKGLDSRQTIAARVVALRRFQQVAGTRISAPCDIVVVGHSYIEGYPSASYRTRFTDLLLNALRTALPTPGVTGGIGYLTTYSGPPSPFPDDPITRTGSGGIYSGVGLGRKAFQLVGATDVVTYTAVPCTDFSIVYAKSQGHGTAYYKVDGGSPVTFSTATGGAQLDGQLISVTGLTAGNHTIEIGWSSGGTVWVDGIVFYDGDASKGIRMWNAGRGGVSTPWWTANFGWFDNISVIQPALVVLCTMTNDWYSGSPTQTAAQAKVNLQALIAAIRSYCTISPSFVICAEFQRGDGSGSEPWDYYVQAAYEIAAADTGGPGGASSVAVYEMGQRFVEAPFNAANLLVTADHVHPTQGGYQYWADDFAAWLLRRDIP